VFLKHFETLRAIKPAAARVPLRLLAASRPSVRRKRTAAHAPKGHIRFARCCADASKKKTGFAPPKLAWRM
jgi:hypothetical protein